eukprot:m.126647 g.126647  ORF g.126647 m.126647 type:complete len:87 (+) comp13838_c0_seq4:960-1220(+)
MVQLFHSVVSGLQFAPTKSQCHVLLLSFTCTTKQHAFQYQGTPTTLEAHKGLENGDEREVYYRDMIPLPSPTPLEDQGAYGCPSQG